MTAAALASAAESVTICCHVSRLTDQQIHSNIALSVHLSALNTLLNIRHDACRVLSAQKQSMDVWLVVSQIFEHLLSPESIFFTHRLQLLDMLVKRHFSVRSDQSKGQKRREGPQGHSGVTQGSLRGQVQC